MADTSARFWKTLRDLALAMFNATLILLAICLFLGLKLATTVNDFTAEVAQNLISVEPLREDVRGLTDEVSALRHDLSVIRSQSGTLTSEAAQALTARIDQFDSRVDGLRDKAADMRGRLDQVALDPRATLDHAIEVAVAEMAESAASLVGCLPQSAELTAAPPAE